MDRVCKNCINAYNSRADGKVHCVNKAWEMQFDPYMTDDVVNANETCGTFTPRRPDQPKLLFNQPIQLELFPS